MGDRVESRPPFSFSRLDLLIRQGYTIIKGICGTPAATVTNDAAIRPPNCVRRIRGKRTPEMKKLSLTMIFIAMFGLPVFAHTSADLDFTCPICQTKFKAEVDISGTSFGQRLDLKPVGCIAAPTSIPVCPKCHFVLYKDDFSKEELEECRQVVDTAEYKRHSGRASYFLLGVIWEQFKKDAFSTGTVFLKASWQEESLSENLRDDLERCIKYYDIFLQDATERSDNRQTAQLLRGEALRRLGRFDEAKSHFNEIQGEAEFQNNRYSNIIKFQLSLCDLKDISPHDNDEANDYIKSRNPQNPRGALEAETGAYIWGGLLSGALLIFGGFVLAIALIIIIYRFWYKRIA
jgi:uncharacterized protein (DUF2225 family)